MCECVCVCVHMLQRKNGGEKRPSPRSLHLCRLFLCRPFVSRSPPALSATVPLCSLFPCRTLTFKAYTTAGLHRKRKGRAKALTNLDRFDLCLACSPSCSPHAVGVRAPSVAQMLSHVCTHLLCICTAFMYTTDRKSRLLCLLACTANAQRHFWSCGHPPPPVYYVTRISDGRERRRRA